MSQRRPTLSQSLKTVSNNRGGPRSSGPLRPATSAQASTTITVRVPILMQQRGARKIVITPRGEAPWKPYPSHLDDTLIKALARAFRWKRLLEMGHYSSITELAVAEDVTESYLCRILRLTLLSPTLVEAVLDGNPNAVPPLQKLIQPFPAEWKLQEAMLNRHQVARKRVANFRRP
jgi:hypothetical protein